MSSIVTISNQNAPGGKPVYVLVQAVSEDGRERHENGFHRILPQGSKTMVVDAGQCFRVMDSEDQPAQE